MGSDLLQDVGLAPDKVIWPLIGRDEEVALALEGLDEHGCVVLTGAAGVGKTRLAREIFERAAAGASRSEWISATQAAATIPLGAVAHLVPRDAIGRGRVATLRSVVAVLEESSASQGLRLGVDDAHLLDEASAALVNLLVASGAAAAVVTVREGESVPDAITSLWKDGSAPLFNLQPLARAEVEHLLSTVLATTIDGASLRLLWDLSRGNALFLCELVRDGIQSGALRRDGDVWRWHGPLEPGTRLQDVIALRMGRLDEGDRHAVELLAVGGPLARVCVKSLGEEPAVARLEQRGLARLSPSDDGEVALSHPLFGELVRARLASSRLDEIRLRLADAVESTSDSSPTDVMRVAVWRAEAGDRTRPAQLVTAARHAWAIGAPVLAERLARAALESGPEFEAGYLLGETLADQGRSEEALAAWAAVEDLDCADGVRASLAIARAGVLAYQLGRVDRAEQILASALGQVTDDHARRRLAGAVALGAASNPSWRGLDPRDVAVPLPATRVVPIAAQAEAIDMLARGRFETAIELIDGALDGIDEWTEHQPGAAVGLGMIRAWVLALSGRPHAGRDAADTQYTAFLELGGDQPRGRLCLVRGMIAVIAGRPRSAVQILREASTLMEMGDVVFLRATRAALAAGHALLGEVSVAGDYERAAADANRSLDRIFGVEVMRAGAWVSAARGELSMAVSQARDAADHARADGQDAYEALAMHDVARFGHAASVVDRLTELSAKVDGSLIDGFAAHARALADDDGRALDDVSASFEDLGFELFAAEASAAAAGAHRRAGRKASSYAAAARAREIAERCEGSVTPALQDVDRSYELTDREREVAALAAQGLASREIAVKLTISTRTVDNLLGRVYSKLGLSGREELPRYFTVDASA